MKASSSAGRRDTRNARGRATVEAIEREAVRLALEHGPALTVDQICAAVGISQRTFFNHFDTKDDALLGWDLPRLNEQRARAYLTDPDVGVLSGAVGLVDLPAELSDDPDLARARMRVVVRSPDLAERHRARLRPLAAEVAEIVYLKLRSLPHDDVPDERLRSAAALVTQMAAALTLGPPGEGSAPDLPRPGRAGARLDDLRWIWPRLI